MRNNQRGITLIALVITIIVLLILAGVTISLTIGENGIFKTAEQAGMKNEEANAKEKLEIALLELQTEKAVNVEYNQNEYIDNYLLSKQMVVIGDIVVVDGWQFGIDRSVPEIAVELGKGHPNEEIRISVTQVISSDFVKSTLKAEIIYSGEISYIQIAGKEIQVPEKADGKYVVEVDVKENGKYIVIAKDNEDNFKTEAIEVKEITNDMEIATKEDLITFRDMVNNGRTFEGRTVRVVADIDLNEGKYTINQDGSVIFTSDAEQWIPIGNVTGKYFNGEFDGRKSCNKRNIYK